MAGALSAPARNLFSASTFFLLGGIRTNRKPQNNQCEYEPNWVSGNKMKIYLPFHAISFFNSPKIAPPSFRVFCRFFSSQMATGDVTIPYGIITEHNNTARRSAPVIFISNPLCRKDLLALQAGVIFASKFFIVNWHLVSNPVLYSPLWMRVNLKTLLIN